MDFPNVNEIPPDIFIKSVLAATHKVYSGDRKKIKHTKSVKLVLKVAERCGYTRIGNGFYKHGHFSFRVFSLMNSIFPYQSLHGMRRDTSINFELVDFVTPIIIEMNKLFLGQFKLFMKKAHTIDVPLEYLDLYTHGDNFENLFASITKFNKKELSSVYNLIQKEISEFDVCLKHVPKERVDIYFKFTELLEGVLLVCKYRDFNTTVGKKIISDLFYLYKDYVSYLLYPYIETLSGEDIEYEKEKYNTSIQNKMKYASMRFGKLENKIIEYHFQPTINELDTEISIELNKMDKKERTQLFNLLSPSE
jgi:hypothetical protein